MADIFISYASEDRDKAEILASNLQEQGRSVWWDRDLPFGRPFDEVIRTELKNSGCVVAIWTERAVNSLYVIGEARDALRLGKLISVFLSVPHVVLPYDLQAIQGVELIDWHGDASNIEFQRLARGITTLLGCQLKDEAMPLDQQALGQQAHTNEKTEVQSSKIATTSKHKRRLFSVGAVSAVAVLIFVVLLFTARQNLSRTPKVDKDLFVNSIGMKFVYVEPGTYTMGSPKYERGRVGSERQHQVSLTNGFYIQTTEATQKQWQAVMGINPSYFKTGGDDYPVEHVSWNDTQDFIDLLNKREGVHKYRLPTEAEWEYVARAGSTSRFSYGDSDSQLSEYAWFEDFSENETHQVATKKPNDWGLYDTHGNVWEWCQDWFGDYPSEAVKNPKGPSLGTERVVRGGSWNTPERFCRTAFRYGITPGNRNGDMGFRLVMDAGKNFATPTPSSE